jgi:hypothetical protein
VGALAATEVGFVVFSRVKLKTGENRGGCPAILAHRQDCLCYLKSSTSGEMSLLFRTLLDEPLDFTVGHFGEIENVEVAFAAMADARVAGHSVPVGVAR